MQSEIQKINKYISIIFGISIIFSIFYVLGSIYFFFINILLLGLVLLIIGLVFSGLSIGILKKSKTCAIIALVIVSICCLSSLSSHIAFTSAIELLLVFLYAMAVKQISAYYKLINAATLEKNEQINTNSIE